MTMIRRKTLLPIVLALVLFFLFTATYLSGERVTRLTNNPPKPVLGNKPVGDSKAPAQNQKEKPPTNLKPSPAAQVKPTPAAKGKTTTTLVKQPTKQTSSPYSPPVKDGLLLKADNIITYLDSILGYDDHDKERLSCQDIDDARYKELKPAKNARKGLIPFFFALNLKNNRELLPQLLGSLYTISQYLGPENVAISIVEGNSDDGMFDILEALKPIFKQKGIYYEAKVSDINPKEGDRIVKLADLRNLALEPLWQDHESFDASTTVLFVNDVFICPNDLLELALQRVQLGAYQTCAMDWHFPGENPLFYDVWVTRGLGGDSFFRILGKKGKEWDLAEDLFFNDPVAKERYEALLPFQVWSCWNGATAFSAQPLLEGVRFRGPVTGECYQGEPQMFGKDFWMRGYGKIAVVPSVNFGYEAGGKKAKDKKGYTGENIKNRTQEMNKIKWQIEPPKKYLCINGWDNQFNETWNAGFEKMKPADFKNKNMPARV